MKFLVLSFCLALSTALYAQQRPQYSQYILNNYLLNPALSGIENYTDVKLGFRQQWTGLPDAPKTSFVSAQWALGDQYLWSNALSFEEKGNDPRSKNLQQTYTASPNHHGVGFSAVSDKAGKLQNLTFNLSYAYHLQVQNTLNLALGIAAGVNRIGIDVNALILENPSDPALKNAIQAQVKPDVSVGLWLYGARFFAGASVQQLLPQEMPFSKDENYTLSKQVAHLFLTSGYKFYLAEDVHITPSIMIKLVEPLPTSIDVNLKMGFKDRFWLGTGYRKNDAFNVMAGVNISHLVNLTYAYDFNTSDLKQVSTGSHEIVLGLLLNNVYKVVCPKRMW
ncbi:PorP/SprF family type IX secretion system membrane protein [Pedobacter sp. MW01-1-1]|uniref:PorP/SprF family type IX secretion system membrane protein n=1 Tax=Pedobacter sp. MW01-1-1 TaxID=3383027 RepID=UPI003FF01254